MTVLEGWFLAVAAAGFWTGILAEGALGPGLTLLVNTLILASSLALIAWQAFGRSRGAGRVARTAPLVFGFLLLGVGWSGIHGARIRASPLARLVGHSVEFTGALTSDPESGRLGWHSTVAVADLAPSAPGWPKEMVVHDAVWIEGHGVPPRGLGEGDRVHVTGVLRVSTGGFARFLRQRGLAASCSVGEFRFVGPPTSPLVRAADAVRGGLRSSVTRVFPPREGGLLLGLALGDTSRLDPTIEEQFRATGLSHLTAVSGENLAMFLAPILGVMTWLGLGRHVRFAVGLASIGFFVLLTRGELSVMRAAAMSGLTMLGVFLGRPRSPPAIMGAAILVLLSANPTLVYAIGFQLSVAATAGMALLSTPVSERLRFLPNGLRLAAGASIGAQAGVTPLLLYHFGAVPTVSIPANLLAFPSVGPGMLLGLAAAAVGLLPTGAGLALAWVARIPLGYLEGLAERLARSPLPSITSPGRQMPVLVVGLTAVLGAAWWIRGGLRVPRRVAVVAGFVLPLLVWSNAIGAGPPRALTVTFFDVGQGDAALIRSPGGATILIDGGPDPEVVATKLAALGVRRLDLMVATHQHADHVAGLPAVLIRFPVGLVIDPGCRGDSPFYAAFLRAVMQAHVAFRHPRFGDVLRVGDVRLDVLGPEHCFHGTDSDPNNDSLVLKVTDGPASIMFPGDAEKQNQTDLLRDEAPLLQATLLKVPHHGGNTSLDQFFLTVHPRVAVISVGHPNLYGHPSPVVLATLARDDIRFYRTDRVGDVTVAFKGPTLSIQSGHG